MVDKFDEFWDDIKWWIRQNEEPVIVVVILVIVIGFLVALFAQPMNPVTISGYLLDKQYEGARSSTGIGSGVSSNGSPVTVVTTDSTPEKWILVLRYENGSIHTWNVSAQTYYKYEQNTYIHMPCWKGKWIPITSCS